MWKLDHKEGWAPKNWHFWTVVLEKTFDISMDYKEIQPVNSKGNLSWIFIGSTDTEAELQNFGHLMQRWLIGKDPDTEKDRGQEEKGWHRMKWLDSITKSMDMNLRKLEELVKDREMSHAVIQGVTKSWTQLSNWTTIATGVQTKIVFLFYFLELVLILMKSFWWSGFWNIGLGHEPLKKKDFFCLPRMNIYLI